MQQSAIGRIQLRFHFNAGEIVGTVVDPDVVVLIDGQTGDAAHLPLVGQRLGPARIDFVLRRRFRLRSQATVVNAGKEKNRTNSEHRETHQSQSKPDSA